MLNDESPPLINVIFSYLFVGNVLLFLLWLPAFIYQFSNGNREANRFLLPTIIMIVYSIYSYHAFYSGIDLPDLEGRPSRYGPMSAGDKEFFKLFSKPIALVIQVFLLVTQFGFLVMLYF